MPRTPRRRWATGIRAKRSKVRRGQRVDMVDRWIGQPGTSVQCEKNVAADVATALAQEDQTTKSPILKKVVERSETRLPKIARARRKFRYAVALWVASTSSGKALGGQPKSAICADATDIRTGPPAWSTPHQSVLLNNLGEWDSPRTGRSPAIGDASDPTAWARRDLRRSYALFTMVGIARRRRSRRPGSRQRTAPTRQGGGRWSCPSSSPERAPVRLKPANDKPGYPCRYGKSSTVEESATVRAQ